jgi:hypothetical protein
MAALRPAPLLVALALGAGTVAGCGADNKNAPVGGASANVPQQISSGGGGGNELSASDAATVLGAYRTIGRACSRDQNAIRQVPQAVKVIDSVTTQYPTKTWEVGSADRAVVMYELSSQLSGILKQCGLPGSDVLSRRAQLGRDAA